LSDVFKLSFRAFYKVLFYTWKKNEIRGRFMTEFRRNAQQAALIEEMRRQALAGKTEMRPLSTAPSFQDGDEWRCAFCKRDKFGVVKDGKLEMKYREREWNLEAPEGRLSVRCRSCGQLNVLNLKDAGIGVNLNPQVDVVATEAAQKLADEHGIDLRTVEGSGKDGGVIKSDVEKIIEERERLKQEEESRVVSRQTIPRGASKPPGVPPARVGPPAPGAYDDEQGENVVEVDERE